MKNWRHQLKNGGRVHQDNAPEMVLGLVYEDVLLLTEIEGDSSRSILHRGGLVATSTPDFAPWLGRAHLSEAVVDSGTLVSSNRDFWKVDRNCRVIQHIHLILNPEKTNMNYNNPSKSAPLGNYYL